MANYSKTQLLVINDLENNLRHLLETYKSLKRAKVYPIKHKNRILWNKVYKITKTEELLKSIKQKPLTIKQMKELDHSSRITRLL